MACVKKGIVDKRARGRPHLEYIKQVIQNAGADNLTAMTYANSEGKLPASIKRLNENRILAT